MSSNARLRKLAGKGFLHSRGRHRPAQCIPWSAALAVVALLAAAGSGCASSWESYFQVRLTAPEDQKAYLGLRRLKLTGKGALAPGATYYLQGLFKDGNRSSTDGRVVLQEAYLHWRLPAGAVTAGQFKPPLGLERFISDAVMPLIDRSQATDRLVPNGSLGYSFTRDYGIQWEGGVQDLGYALGVFSGSGANEPVRGTGPLLVGRLHWEPRVGARPAPGSRLQVETAISWRHSGTIDFSGQLPGSGALGYRHFAGEDWRENLAARWQRGRAAYQGEVFFAQYHSRKPGVPGIDAWGSYLQTAYRLSPRWEMAARYETFDPGTPGQRSNALAWTTLGGTYNLRGDRERLQANYVVKRERGVQTANNTWLVQYQRFLW